MPILPDYGVMGVGYGNTAINNYMSNRVNNMDSIRNLAAKYLAAANGAVTDKMKTYYSNMAARLTESTGGYYPLGGGDVYLNSNPYGKSWYRRTVKIP